MKHYEIMRFVIEDDNSGVADSLHKILSLDADSEIAKIERKALYFRVREDMIQQGLIDKHYYITLGFTNSNDLVVMIFDKEIKEKDMIDFNDCHAIELDTELNKYYMENNEEEI